MKSKLKYLVGVSLKRKIKTKWFVIANVVLALLIIGIANIDTIITSFGGDFNKKTTVYVIDKTDKAYDLFNEQMKVSNNLFGNNKESDYVIAKYDKTEAEARKELEKDDENKIVIVFEPSDKKVIDVKMITKEYMDMMNTQLINTAINSTKISMAIHESNISMEEITKIYEPVTIERLYIDESKTNSEESAQIVMSTVFPIVILPFFMLTLFLIQMIGAEVNDEKTTKSMEIIISNVSPKTHFFAKIISGNLFVLIQGGILLLSGGLALIVRMFVSGGNMMGGLGSTIGSTVQSIFTSAIGQKLIYIIPLTLVLMLLTFLAYSLLAGILASMTTNTEDFQQLQTPIIIISLIGYYLAIMAGLFEGSLFIRLLSYVPLISAILAPSLLVLGQIGIIDIVIAIVINIVFNFILIKYGLKIYKVGILNYSSKDLWKKMFKALKEN